jgi:hypothetical protein
MTEIRDDGVYVSQEIAFDIRKLENKFYRADIEIHNLDHSGQSYEGRVFLNNPNANQRTPVDEEHNYVGSYHVFGHGGCYGDIGHCDVVREKRRYDRRLSSDIRPQYKRIIATSTIKKIGGETDRFTITIVPVLYGDELSQRSLKKDIIKFDNIGIITYD